MSFLTAIFYYPYYNGFNLLTFLANWLKLVCYNFPFAFFSQLFFIQPAVRVIFGFLFRKNIAQGQGEGHADVSANEIPAYAAAAQE